MLEAQLQNRLRSHPLRRRLIAHPFFTRVGGADLNRDQVAVFLGQWWHPLHYFPDFLSRLIATTQRLEVRTAISKILYQELGEGVPARAHEVSYIDTMGPLGFPERELTGASPLPATSRLLRTYAESSTDPLAGLGCLYGTEVADLAMVSGIGTAVRRLTGAKSLPWVDIHVEQEPEHVARATATMGAGLTEADEAAVLAGAEAVWTRWIAFFDELETAVFGAPVSRAS